VVEFADDARMAWFELAKVIAAVAVAGEASALAKRI
jgi:hypothetical protein